MRSIITFVAVLSLCVGATALAQTDSVLVDSAGVTPVQPPPAPVTNLQAVDTDNDHGHSITLTWDLSVDDGKGQNNVLSYQIFRWFPSLMDQVDSLRGERSNARSTMRAFRSDIPRAEHALNELREDPGKLESIRFEVSIPADDSAFVLTTDYAITALQDTIAVMTARLPEIKDGLEPLQIRFEEALAQLPEAHNQYPNDGDWEYLGAVVAGNTSYENSGSKDFTAPDFFPDYTDLYYRVEAVSADTTLRSEAILVGPVHSSGQWFHTGKIPVLIFVLVFFVLTVLFVQVAKKGKELYVRPLAGIEAVDDAIGRATEMGRPILYVLGLGSADMVATIASFTILGRVAKKVAEYQTPIIVPCYDPIVMAVAQEVVKSSYLDAGRPDDYDEDAVHFVTNLQFAYVAAVNGTMLRELPATNIYMGKFFAESLLLAETGALAGSIQIAGTDEIAQIPFFIVACDYTLIGEELYAASAYLGREPILLGSLKAQDWAKAAIVIIAIVGMLTTAFGWPGFAEAFHVSG
ncbi:MAG: hypothetical protein J7J98_08450 [candidate division Zixibacteria bacterium]|nr:hypothetical protein [candidate division Zixibacteria bacterium]